MTYIFYHSRQCCSCDHAMSIYEYMVTKKKLAKQMCVCARLNSKERNNPRRFCICCVIVCVHYGSNGQEAAAVNLIKFNETRSTFSSLALSLLLSHWSFQAKKNCSCRSGGQWRQRQQRRRWRWWKLSHLIVHIGKVGYQLYYGCKINTFAVFEQSPCRFDKNEIISYQNQKILCDFFAQNGCVKMKERIQ